MSEGERLNSVSRRADAGGSKSCWSKTTRLGRVGWKADYRGVLSAEREVVPVYANFTKEQNEAVFQKRGGRSAGRSGGGV